MLKIKGLYLPMLANQIVTGDVFFLDGGATNTNDDPRNGKDPIKPFSTIDYALSKMVTNNDDLLVVGAGHSETLTGAGGFTQDVSGCRIIGMGLYDRRPTFLMDGASITGLITASNFSMENMIFSAGHADIGYCFHITGKGVQLKSLAFEENTTNENWVDVIHAGTADNDYDGLVIDGCSFRMDDIAAVTAIDCLKNSRDVKIVNNRVQGDFDASPYAAIYSVSTEVHKNCEIARNHIHNAHDGNGAIAISFGSTTSTGFMHDNLASGNEATGSTPFVSGAGGMQLANNLYSGDDSTSGYVLPAIGAN